MEASLPSNSRNCSAYIEESGAQTSKPSKENAKSSHEMERSSQRKHELTGTIERDRRFTCTSRNGKNLSRNVKTNSDQGASVGGRAVAGLEGASQQLQILSSNQKANGDNQKKDLQFLHPKDQLNRILGASQKGEQQALMISQS